MEKIYRIPEGSEHVILQIISEHLQPDAKRDDVLRDIVMALEFASKKD